MSCSSVSQYYAEDFNGLDDNSIYFLKDYYSDTAFIEKINIVSNEREKIALFTGTNVRKFMDITFNNNYIVLLFQKKVVIYNNEGNQNYIKTVKIPKGYRYLKIKCIGTNIYIYHYTEKSYINSKAKILKYNIAKPNLGFVNIFEINNSHSSPFSMQIQNNYIDFSNKYMVFSKIHSYSIVLKNLLNNSVDTLKRDIIAKSDLFLDSLKKVSIDYERHNKQKDFDKLQSFLHIPRILNVKLFNDSTLFVFYNNKKHFYDIWVLKNNKWNLSIQNKLAFYFKSTIVNSSNYPIWNGRFSSNKKGDIVLHRENYNPIIDRKIKEVFSREYQDKKNKDAFIVYKFVN